MRAKLLCSLFLNILVTEQLSFLKDVSKQVSYFQKNVNTYAQILVLRFTFQVTCSDSPLIVTDWTFLFKFLSFWAFLVKLIRIYRCEHLVFC